MIDDEIIERGRKSLNFIEQLQNQIQLCREAISDEKVPLTLRVEALESLLWAKIKDNQEYKKELQDIEKWFIEKMKDFDRGNFLKNLDEHTRYICYQREKATRKFRAIMVFIDKKNLMPLGEEENE